MANVFYEFAHAPGANLDYSFDWSLWLELGDTLVASSWASPNLTLTNDQLTGNVTLVFAQGGVVGTSYPLVNTVTTANGLVDSRTIYLSCKNR